jgi:hypothetical protein
MASTDDVHNEEHIEELEVEEVDSDETAWNSIQINIPSKAQKNITWEEVELYYNLDEEE